MNPSRVGQPSSWNHEGRRLRTQRRTQAPHTHDTVPEGPSEHRQVTYVHEQLMAQTVARRWLVPPLMNRDFRGCSLT
jgi:hypothetical protein